KTSPAKRKIIVELGRLAPFDTHCSPQNALDDGKRSRSMHDRRSSYEYEDLLTCGRGELFGPGNAQLPLPPMLMFDRIAEINETGGEFGKGLIRAELDV